MCGSLVPRPQRSPSDFSLVATIPVGKLPHGIWPSGDGTRVYVGLENGDEMTAIDTLTNKVIATNPIGQAPQAVVYVPNAVPVSTGPELGNAAMSVAGASMPKEAGTEGLQPLGVAGQAAHFTMAPAGPSCGRRRGADQRDAVRSGGWCKSWRGR